MPNASRARTPCPARVAVAALALLSLALAPVVARAQVHPPDARWPHNRPGGGGRSHRWIPDRTSPFVMGGGALMTVASGGFGGSWLMALGAECPTSHSWALVPRLGLTVNNDPSELLWARAGAAMRFSSSSGGALGYWEFGPTLGLIRERDHDRASRPEVSAGAAGVRAAFGMRGRPGFGPVWMVELADELGGSSRHALFAMEIAAGVAF